MTTQPPIDMVLHCPKCGVQHIDAPESDDDYRDKHLTHGGFDDQWTNPPHRSHLCHGCGHIWRPADVPTNGVAEVKTKGKADSAIAWPTRTAGLFLYCHECGRIGEVKAPYLACCPDNAGRLVHPETAKQARAGFLASLATPSPQPDDRKALVWEVKRASPAAPAAPVERTEQMYLVHAGGDAYQAEIVPASRLDDAYLLTQWCNLSDIDADERADALAHFHDGDSWTHEHMTGHGERVKFYVSFEDGWVEVIRLPPC